MVARTESYGIVEKASNTFQLSVRFEGCFFNLLMIAGETSNVAQWSDVRD